MHLVLATQRPAGVVDDAIRANTDLRIALRLADVADSVDVLGDPVAATIPRRTPGRAAVRTAGATADGPALRLIQVAAVDGGEEGLRHLVDLVAAAHRDRGGDDPHRPWLPPLPADVGASELDPSVVGMVDDPQHQRRIDLRWDPTVGNLALVGGRRTGTTTALVTIAATRATDAHLYVLDARGDADLERLDLLPSCAGVIRVHETERVDRCLRLLAARVTRPSTSGPSVSGPSVSGPSVSGPSTAAAPAAVLLIDGLGELRRSLDDPDRAETLAHLDRVLADGPGVGIRSVAVLDPATANGSVIGRFAERWVFHLDDPADGPTLGVPARAVPPRVPGRIVVASTGLTAQLAVRAPADVDLPVDRRPRRVEVLPAVIRPDEVLPPVPGPGEDLRPGVRPGDDTPGVARSVVRSGDGSPGRPAGEVCIGLRSDDLEPAPLEIRPGDHLAVVGSCGSGRTTALRSIAAGWTVRYGNEAVEIVPSVASAAAPGVGRRVEVPTSPTDALVSVIVRAAQATEPLLVVVDDADRIDDPLGRVAAALEVLPASVTLAVALRSDAAHLRHGHWTAAVRRSGRGLVAATGSPHDGEPLGVLVPRRVGIPWRPGLWWMVGRRGADLVQVTYTEAWPSQPGRPAAMMET